MNELTAAMIQATFFLDDIPANIAKTESLCAQAAERGAKVIVFPEAALTGSLHHLPKSPDLHKHAAVLPGPETERLSSLARDLDIGIIIGTMEAGENHHLYNAAFAVAPEGYLGKFRKLFPAPSEKGLVLPGRETPVFEMFGWRFGVGVCYDLYFPEVARLYALKSADVFVVPTGGTGLPPDRVHAKWWKPAFNLAGYMKVCPARALDNGLYVLVSVAADAGGGSVAVDPRGEQIAYGAGDEEVILVTIRRDKVEKAQAEYLPDLRQDVYRALIDACGRQQSMPSPSASSARPRR